MSTSYRRRKRRSSVPSIHFENLEPRNLLAADLANIAFADVGNAGLIYQLNEPVPVEQRLDVLQLHTGIGSRESFQLQRVETDQLGFSHFRYQQLAYGMPVEHAMFTVHARNGMIESISGDHIIASQADPTSSLSESAALNLALEHIRDHRIGHHHHHGDHLHDVDHEHDDHHVEAPIGITADSEINYSPSGQTVGIDIGDALVGEKRTLVDAIPSEKVFLESGEGEVSLAYRFELQSNFPVYRADIYVDANSGEILNEIERVHSADVDGGGVALFDGIVDFTVDSFGTNPDYRLQANADGSIPTVITLDMMQLSDYSQAVDVVSDDPFFDDFGTSRAVQTHFGAESSVDFFSETFGRNSYDNNGTTLLSYFSFSVNYVNAFWNGSFLTFGDGDGVNYWPLVSVDVVGHEFTHGVIEWTANLIYQNEMGALNESFADIFGEAIEEYATGESDWEIGADIVVNGGHIRGMQDPKSGGNPDTYLGQYWYSGADDAGGVHTNGTVQNHWYYILSQGKSGTNDNGDSYNVAGIGIEDATRIAYRNLSVYLTPGSQYVDARVGSIQSAIDLFGLDSPQHLATEQAWDAVGVYGLDLNFHPEVVSTAIGSLIYSDDSASEIYFDGYVDDGSIRLDAGQTLSLQVESDSLVPTIVLYDPAGNVVATETGTTNETILQTAPVSTPGVYTVEITGENSTIGPYNAELVLNAGFESEEHSGPGNDQFANAEDLDSTTVPLGTDGADRLAVMSYLGEGTLVHAGDDFESGTFGPEWTLSSSEPDGKIENWGGPGTNSGTQAMIMHRLPSGAFNLNEAVISVDLDGVTGSRLQFWAASWHDELHYMPIGSYTGSVNADGVSLSVDGNTWYPLLDYVETPYGEYEYYEFDLDSFAATHGITLGNNVQFKFQQYDDFAIYSDGIGWDDIMIAEGQPSVDWYKFTLDSGQIATIAGHALSGPQDLLVELYDSFGNLLHTGNQFEGQTAISQFVNTGASDTFYVKTSGQTHDYGLVVTRDADYNVEPNSLSNPQDITNVGGVLGSVFKYLDAVAEPDDFSDGNILDNAFADVTFSNEIGNGSVWAADTDEVYMAPTGTIVFAPDFGASDGWREGENELRADFALLQPKVSIDVGSDDSSDVGWLRAYNSSGLLLESVQSGSIPEGGSVTLTIDRGVNEIAHIVASGFDFNITPLDNLRYTDFTIDDDHFSVSATVGEQLDFHGLLPGDGDGEFDNGLDTPNGSMLGMELFDPAGNMVASDNEVISHTAAASGDYGLRVFAQEGRGEYFISRSITTQPIDVEILGTKFLDGSTTSSKSATYLGDDIYYEMIPGATSNPFKQKIDLIVIAETTNLNPNSFGFRLEASMNGGPTGDVVQTISVFNESTNDWDLLHTSATLNDDDVVEVFVSGNASDYVHPTTGEIIARLVWNSESFTGSPFNWTVDVDQAGWLIA